MLQRTITFTYSTLLRILGGCFLLYGLYVILLVLTAQLGIGQSAVPMITNDPMDLENYIFYGGPGDPRTLTGAAGAIQAGDPRLETAGGAPGMSALPLPGERGTPSPAGGHPPVRQAPA